MHIDNPSQNVQCCSTDTKHKNDWQICTQDLLTQSNCQSYKHHAKTQEQFKEKWWTISGWEHLHHLSYWSIPETNHIHDYEHKMDYQFSITILDFSRMNFPSLYFWVSSYALSYFHPRISWQSEQCTSATVWRPVMSCLSSLGPTLMFIARENKNARPCLPWHEHSNKFIELYSLLHHTPSCSMVTTFNKASVSFHANSTFYTLF